MELLFESRSNLSKFSGTLHFVQWQPEIHQEAVLRPDTFVDGAGVSGYGTVLSEGGTLRMWYQAVPQDWPGPMDVAAVAYAESEDGYLWKKKPLGLVKHGPGENHLCDLGLHSPSVFVDPDSPPSHRYRATGFGNKGTFAVRPGLRRGYYTAHSGDGLHWELDTPEPQWEDGDVITSIYHPGRNSGIVSLKKRPQVNRLRRRCIHTAGYRQGEYSAHHVSALYPDEYDDSAAAQRGHFTTDYYGMSMMPAGENSVVGFLCNFRHDLPYSERPYATRGHSDITLVYQEREGDRWLHFPGRPNFISHRDLPWTNEGWISATSTPVGVGDEHRLYFGGRNYEHGMDMQPHERLMQWIKEESISGITFARWPKHRLFGLETPRKASFDIQLDNMRAPFQLRLNYQTRYGGSVRVSIEGDKRYSKDSCIALSGDEIDATVSWQSGPIIHPPASGRVLVTVHLEMAAVYAYETKLVR